jgi:hypothetical protein
MLAFEGSWVQYNAIYYARRPSLTERALFTNAYIQRLLSSALEGRDHYNLLWLVHRGLPNTTPSMTFMLS